MRWLIVFLLAFVLFSGLAGWLSASASAGCRATSASAWRGREWFVPMASSVLLSLIAMGIGALSS